MKPETDPEEIVGDKEMIDFRKINIFGESGVGKSSFISWLENYENEDYQIVKDDKSDSLASFEDTVNLVQETVKKVRVPINKKRDIHFLVYETNIDNFIEIKNNLDTLLLQTECVLIMWDSSSTETFDNIPKLVYSVIKNLKNDNIKIYIVQNKIDLDQKVNEEEKKEKEDIVNEINKLKNNYKNSVHEIKISLLNKENIYDLLLNINESLDKKANNLVEFIKFKYPIQLIGNNEIDNIISICLVGKENSGKKEFLKSLLNVENNNINIIEQRLDKYYLAIELFYYRAEQLLIKISKTSELNEDLCKSCHGFLVFLDLTDVQGFKNVKNYIEQIQKEGRKIIILGNKIDMIEERKIHKKTAHIFKNNKDCKYIECSCLNKINVLEAFRDIVELGYIQLNDDKEKLKENKEENSNEENNEENKEPNLDVKNKEELLENQEKNLSMENQKKKINGQSR